MGIANPITPLFIFFQLIALRSQFTSFGSATSAQRQITPVGEISLHPECPYLLDNAGFPGISKSET
jgi:hypothetical protein